MSTRYFSPETDPALYRCPEELHSVSWTSFDGESTRSGREWVAVSEEEVPSDVCPAAVAYVAARAEWIGLRAQLDREYARLREGESAP